MQRGYWLEKVNIVMIIAKTAVVFAACLVFSVQTIAFDGLEDGVYERLQSGEVIVNTLDRDLPGGAAKAEALFYAPAERIWEVLGHCEYEFVYVKGLKECEVLQAGDKQMVLRHRLRNSWYTPTLEFTFSATRSDDGRGEANLLEGNLKVMHGTWQLIPVESGEATMVIHEIRVQPKMPAPRWLIRRSLNKDLPNSLACIRGLAQASGGLVQEAADLRRCPGNVGDLTNKSR